MILSLQVFLSWCSVSLYGGLVHNLGPAIIRVGFWLFCHRDPWVCFHVLLPAKVFRVFHSRVAADSFSSFFVVEIFEIRFLIRIKLLGFSISGRFYP